ncbi:B12-binding domain-containing radical SAM protein [Mangrovihabitans endophyticus]|uniref:Radical SAM superfamily enzyme YgiQ, UPF0313 family n=1 Tax=Mangrovihabitans endophyticus TaxID=1751298 RepID=A0A8J3BXF9_9ACTN|nr:radical SAM protein [Mangrovihabitans endophyticus]GGK78124.1 hypothetical protein GCM10012284_10050 [Mangrovihabitans endophyticus]
MSKLIVLLDGVDGITMEDGARWMPLSILTIGSYLKHHGYDPVLLDPQVHPDWKERLADLAARRPVFLGVSCLTGPSIYNALDAIEITKAVDPTIPVVWGGYHATLRYSGIVQEGLADAVTRGPGEVAALALARVFERYRSGDPGMQDELRDIPNIAYGSVNDGKIGLRLTPASRIPDMNELPPYDYSLLNPELYYEGDERVILYSSSYGCPYACGYCSEPVNSGRRWRALDPERMVTEIHSLVRRYRPSQINFTDPNFSSDPRRVVTFVEELRKRPADVTFMGCMRARDVVMIAKRMPIRHLSEIGWRRVFIGVETGSDRVLTYLNKASTTQDTYDACALLSEAGIEQWTSFMHDLPTETEEESEETLRMCDRLKSLPHHHQSHNFYMPYPDTQLFQDEYAHLDLSKMRQVDWAESSTKGSALWRGRTAFRHRVIDRLEQMRDEVPEVYSRTTLLGRPDPEPPESEADSGRDTTVTYMSLIQEGLAPR